MTAKQLAVYMVNEMGPVPFVKLQIVMYYANLEAMRDTGKTITDEPFYAEWYGPGCRAITEEWYRSFLGRHGDASLRRRARRWLLQESRRRGGKSRVGKINMPGGWSVRDAAAQVAGMMDAASLGNKWLSTWVVMGGSLPADKC